MKPIFITEEEKERLIKEFADSLKLGMYDGAYSFSRSFAYTEKDHPRATLVYTADAFAKTVAIISAFDSEVAWHAMVHRSANPEIFVIDDVIVYPQEVTGTTVNTDDEGYAKFMIQLTKEQANVMHVQCHSHVNMNTSPSSVDRTHQEKVLQCMNGQGFYVFQIWNKKLETTNFIYDFDNNVMYESKDIDLEIADRDGYCISDMIAEAKKIVKPRSYTNAGKSSYGSAYSGKYPSEWYGNGYKSTYGNGCNGASGKKEEKKDEKPEENDQTAKKTKKQKSAKNKRCYIDDDLYWDDEVGGYVDGQGYFYE